ncbi:MAG TPA: AAA family ATPase, partial [Gemmatimonadales bacterium]|nr:AAA family ATPase [Gemmatimonadales bacterium]
AAALLQSRERFGPGAVLGPLSDFVRARREDAGAVEHVLGEWLHAVVVRDLEVCDAIHAWHRVAAPGPLLLLPLQPGPIGGGDPGELAARVNAEGEAAAWVQRLISGARPFAPTGDAIVRANGAVFLPGPLASGGPLRRRAELEALADDAARLEGDLAEQARAIEAAAASLSRAEREAALAEEAVETTRALERQAAAEADDARRTVANLDRDLALASAAVTRLGERLGAVEARLVEVNTALSQAELERVRLEGRLDEGRARLAELEMEQDAARERRVHWQVEDAQVSARWQAVREREERATLALAEYRGRIQSLTEEVARLDSEVAALEVQRAQWREELVERQTALNELQRAAVTATDGVGTAERTLEETEAALEHARQVLQQRTEESYRIDLEAAELAASRRVLGERLSAEWGKELDAILADAQPLDGTPEQLRAEADELKAQIEAMGPINPLAVEEHEEEQRRLTHLVTQRDDIVQARNTLQQTVRELDTVARERFMTTFQGARENFQRVFETLFGGGSADVFLVSPDDPLESEIEITAKPRGKKTERIHLLSAGERSLTALSLLFGIYLSKPSPFCLLDEVDAPLDDANIGRFTRLLDQFKDRTQFIVITHNPRTMQAADAVYGVTMQEPGVSSVVSVRLGEATQAA